MNKNQILSKTKELLNRKIEKLWREKEKYVVNPKSDFTRRGKTSFKDDINFIIGTSGRTLKEELYNYFGYNKDIISVPGIVQSRAKIKEEAFMALLKEINKSYATIKKINGYLLCAVDGSDMNIYPDPEETSTRVTKKENRKCANQYHLNAIYDILNHRFIDAIIEGVRKLGEIPALIKLIDSYHDDKTIFMADRGYISYNALEHIRQSGHKFLFRCQDIHSRNSIIKKFNYPKNEEEFDIEVEITLTNDRNIYKGNEDTHRFIASNQNFDYLDKENHEYKSKYRVLRFKINDDYECIITNLDKDEFNINEIKELYGLRWQIETAFRHLKYSVSLLAFHSKKREFIKQEIWARFILYNLSFIVIECINDSKIKKSEKFIYKLNIKNTMHIIRDLLLKRKSGYPPDLLEMIEREILPIRPNRKYACKVYGKSLIHFNYRFS